MSVLTWWLDGGTGLSPQQLDALFRCLTTEGVASASSASPFVWPPFSGHPEWPIDQTGDTFDDQ